MLLLLTRFLKDWPVEQKYCGKRSLNLNLIHQSIKIIVCFFFAHNKSILESNKSLCIVKPSKAPKIIRCKMVFVNQKKAHYARQDSKGTSFYSASVRQGFAAHI